MPKHKIAILGAGVGAMTAAFEITSQPGWQDRYDLTIYQIGWRAGGKGASGRNQVVADRIQEHGLHLWMGFYENAFDLIRRAYDYCRENNLTPGTPFQSYEQAFSRMNFIAVTEYVQGIWKLWPTFWAANDELPGKENAADTKPPLDGSPWSYLVKLVDFARSHLDRLANREPLVQGLIDNLTDDFMSLEEFAPVGGRDTFLHRAVLFVQNLGNQLLGVEGMGRIANLLGLFNDRLFAVLGSLFATNDDVRRDLTVIDTAIASAVGMIRDEVITKGFDAIEQYDFVDWLRRSGCHFALSGLTRSIYDAAFGYRGGNSQNPSMAAGSTLHGWLRLMFTYRGSIMWWMNAGMGDTVFTPLYKALVHRGVKFEFFRRVTRLSPSADARSVGTIEMDIQAHVRPGLPNGYDPLVPVNGLLCWPALPLYNQLTEGQILQDPKFINKDLESWWSDLPTFGKAVLKRGEDFDSVILGISLGALPYLCKEMIESDKTGAWRSMVENVEAIRTQVLQLWLNQTAAQMGWNPSRPEAPVLSGYVEPFDTWSEMTHLIPREGWIPDDQVRQIAYFCATSPVDPTQAPFSDPSYPAKQVDVVFESSLRFLNDWSQLLWPLARDDTRPEQFNWSLLVNRTADTGPAALKSQFFRMNINPSDLYVLALPGTKKYRLAPWDSRFDNLVLAGDWTLNNLNFGCVEAAVQSGKMAAYALSGAPEFVYGSYRRQVPIEQAATA